MPKYKFVTGRYNSQGERISGKTEKTTQGKLSTLSGLRYGKTTRKQVPKSQQTVRVQTKEGTFRNIHKNQALAKRTALSNATKFANNGKFENALMELSPSSEEAKFLIKSLLAMCDRVEAPLEIKEKIAKMDPYRAYTLGKVNRLSVEVVFDYGFTLEDEITDAYVSKWDDLMDFIYMYEKTWGEIL